MRCETAIFHRTTARQGEECESEFSQSKRRDLRGQIVEEIYAFLKRSRRKVASFRAHFSSLPQVEMFYESDSRSPPLRIRKKEI